MLTVIVRVSVWPFVVASLSLSADIINSDAISSAPARAAVGAHWRSLYRVLDRNNFQCTNRRCRLP